MSEAKQRTKLTIVQETKSLPDEEAAAIDTNTSDCRALTYPTRSRGFEASILV